MKPDSVPVIDVGQLRVRNAGGAADGAIQGACRDWGFFQIVNHGVPAEFVQRVWAVTEAFFALPAHLKEGVARDKENARGYYNRELTRNRRDMKEVFDFGPNPAPGLPDNHPSNRSQDGYNRWPDGAACPGFRATLLEYCTVVEQVAMNLLEAVGRSLGLPAGALTGGFARHSSFARLNHYPVLDPLAANAARRAADTGHDGVHAHSDAGALTLLLQDDVGGLEVLRGDEWCPVMPLDGAIVVNIGDIVQVWSNDLYRAPRHRVVASAARDRYSIPYFFNPAYETDYAPLAGINGAARYSQINWGHFREQRQLGDYADFGHEIQIADFAR